MTDMETCRASLIGYCPKDQKIKDLEAKLTKAVEALEDAADNLHTIKRHKEHMPFDPRVIAGSAEQDARATLAEIGGGDCRKLEKS